LHAQVERPSCIETTALGAAYLAGLAVGYWKNTDDILKNWALQKRFSPQMEREERLARQKGWQKAVKRAQNWEKDD